MSAGNREQETSFTATQSDEPGVLRSTPEGMQEPTTSGTIHQVGSRSARHQDPIDPPILCTGAFSRKQQRRKPVMHDLEYHNKYVRSHIVRDRNKIEPTAEAPANTFVNTKNHSLSTKRIHTAVHAERLQTHPVNHRPGHNGLNVQPLPRKRRLQ